jgi:hypothetical protein
MTLSANPTTVAAGARSTLSWTSTNASGCTASGAWAGNKPASGSEQSPVLNQNSTFTLQCTGAGGSVQRSVTVTVNTPPPPAPTLTLSANPTTVSAGARSTLSWTSTNATTCTASGGWTGTRPTSGSEETPVLNQSRTFNLRCTGAGGALQRSVSVMVNGSPPPEPTVTLDADPGTVAPNGTAMLTWSTTDATSCTASGGWTGSKATSGSESTAALSNTTSYTLQCTGAGGSATGSTTVTVSVGGGGGGGGEDPGTEASSGGGALGIPTALLLLIMGLGRRLRYLQLA